MKQIVIIFILLSFNLFSQESSNKKFQLGVSLNVNRTFIENTQINDGMGLKIRGLRQPIGYSLGLRLKYKLSNTFSVNSGLDILSTQKISYFFYGSTYTNSVGLYELPFEIQYSFKQNPFFLIIGGEETFTFPSIWKSTNNKNEFGPKTVVTREEFSGFYTILKLSLGYHIKTKKHRKLEIYTTLSKGFKPIRHFTLERFEPYISSSFDYQGTKIELGVNWYFNSLKK